MYKNMKDGITARLLAIVLVIAMVVPMGPVYAETTDDTNIETAAESSSTTQDATDVSGTTEVTVEDAVYLPITFKDARRDGVFFDRLLPASDYPIEGSVDNSKAYEENGTIIRYVNTNLGTDSKPVYNETAIRDLAAKMQIWFANPQGSELNLEEVKTSSGSRIGEQVSTETSSNLYDALQDRLEEIRATAEFPDTWQFGYDENTTNSSGFEATGQFAHIWNFYDAAEWLLNNLFTDDTDETYMNYGDKTPFTKEVTELKFLKLKKSASAYHGHTDYYVYKSVDYTNASNKDSKVYVTTSYDKTTGIIQNEDNGEYRGNESGGGWYPLGGLGFADYYGVVKDDTNENENLKEETTALVQKMNTAFVTEGSGKFVYDPDKELFFGFQGDDDVLLYIDGKLVIDMSGLYDEEQAYVALESYVDNSKNEEVDAKNIKTVAYTDSEGKTWAQYLGLQEGQVYSFHFFHMERQNWGSAFQMYTNLLGSAVETEKKAFDSNGNKLPYGAQVEQNENITYGFELTNVSTSKVTEMTFSDPKLDVELSKDNIDLGQYGTTLSDIQWSIYRKGTTADYQLLSGENDEAKISTLRTLLESGIEAGYTFAMKGFKYNVGSQLTINNTVYTSAKGYTIVDGEQKVVELPGEASIQLSTFDDSQDGLRVDKTVEADASDSDKFTLTLEAFATGNAMQITATQPADIALVLDQSASMYTPVGWTEDRAYAKDFKTINTKLSDYAISDFVEKANAGDAELLENAKHLGYYVAVHKDYEYIYIVQYAQNEEGNWGWYYVAVDQTTRTVQVDTENTTTDSKEAVEQKYGTVVYGDAQILTNVTYYQSQYGALYDSVKKFVTDLKEQAIKNDVDHKVAIVGFASPFYDGWDGYDGTGIYIDGNYYLYDDDFMYKGSKNEDGTYTYNTNAGYKESDWTGDYILDPDTLETSVIEELAPSELQRAFITEDIYKQALADVSTDAGYRSLMNSIEAVQANYQQTCPAVGIQIAQSIFAERNNTEERDQIIILFTDGVPTVRVDSNRQHGWSDEVATKAKYWSITGGVESAFEIAEEAKVNDGVTIYTIGTSAMQGAAIDHANVNSKTFLEKLSSNYTGITVNASYTNNDTTYVIEVSDGTLNSNPIYAQFASQESGLDVAFDSVLTSVTAPSVDLDENAVLREVLTDSFVLQNNQDADITVWKALYDGKGNFGKVVPLTDAAVTLSSSEGAGTIINADGSTSARYDIIEVRGYDYHDEYISNIPRTISVNGEEVEYYGSKLIVKVAVEARDGFWGGNNIPTNKGNTAIYKEETVIEEFPIPQVNVPRSPEIITKDKVIYYGGDVTSEELIDKVVIDGVEVTVNPDGTFTPQEDWMNAYADLSWSEGSTKPDSSIDNTDSKDYTYTVVLTPTGDGKTNTSDNPSNIAGNPTGAQTDSDTSSVKVLVPIVTFEDSTIEMGEKPDEGYYDTNNIIKENGEIVVTWVEEESGIAMEADDPNTEPELTFTYIPENSDFLEDTKVDVTVSSENDNADENISIMDVLTFEWKECDEELHQHDDQDVATHTGKEDSHEFWIHVIPNYTVEDVVVIDFGIPVDVNVLYNDVFNGTGNVVEVLAGEQTATSGSEDYKQEAAGTFGKLTLLEDDKVRYTLNKSNGMEMNTTEVFTYVVKHPTKDIHYHGKLTIIPATTIYYEDSFLTYKTYSYISDSEYSKSDTENYRGTAATEIANQWTQVPTTDGEVSSEAIQDEDRPASVPNVDADNIYGYDSEYTDMTTYSLDSAMMMTASSVANTEPVNGKDMNGTYTKIYGTAEFTFYGTGFDVISLTSNRTGTITVQVYAVANDGTETLKKTTIVDTYYGYEWNGKDWVVDEDATGALYQVPVMKISGLIYGKYKVVITASYADAFDHGQYDGETKYDFYLDAIRIYDPANDGKENQVIEDAYVADDEGWPEYFELRNLLISKETFDSLGSDTDSVSGIVFIDNTAKEDANKIVPEISDYEEYGPNNEVYLAPGQAISFNMNVTDTSAEVAAVHLALKSVGGTAKVKVYDADDDEVKNVIGTDTIATATDLYYDITSLNGKTVVIANTGTSADAILSITNVKVTYKSQHTDAIENSFFTTNKDAGDVAVASLEELYEEESEIFQPERFEVKVSDSSVKVGSKVTLTVTTSSDVESISVNDETITKYSTKRGSDNRTWTVKVKAEDVGELQISVIAYDADRTASETKTTTVTVTEKKQNSNNGDGNQKPGNDKNNGYKNNHKGSPKRSYGKKF